MKDPMTCSSVELGIELVLDSTWEQDKPERISKMPKDVNIACMVSFF